MRNNEFAELIIIREIFLPWFCIILLYYLLILFLFGDCLYVAIIPVIISSYYICSLKEKNIIFSSNYDS